MRQAIALAEQNVAAGGGPFGALVVRNKQIISATVNRVISNCDPTAHAEILAIRQACTVLGDFQLKDCVLYTSCEPCPMCLGAIYWARLQTVYYACGRQDAAEAGFDDGYIYTEINVAPEQRKIPMRHLHMREALAPFSAWKENTEKALY